MAAIPIPVVTMEDLAAWSTLRDELAAVKAKEILMRDKIYKGLFQAPTEGTNTIGVGLGWQLKAVRNIDRKIDLGVLQAMATPDGPLVKAGIRADDLIKWTPELNLKAYRTLTAEQAAVFDNCLTIKDGTPTVSLVAPKEE